MPEDRRHIAIMFTDIVGYTALMGSDEDKAFDLLKRNHTIHTILIKKHKGKLIKEVGDGTLASFPLASDAVRCAMDIQNEAKNQNIPLKIGIHQGEMVMVGADVFGDGVNVASRLQESTEEGCISISGAVYRDVKNKAGIIAEFLEDKTFKNVDEPIKVYKVYRELKEEVQEALPEKSSNKRSYYIFSGVLIILMVVVLIWFFYPRQQATVNESKYDKSIVVLPFDDLSAEMDNQYFCDGVMEGILNHLSMIKDLRVVSKTSVEQYRENLPPATQIGAELNVTYLLEASVFKSEDKIRITAQLINAAQDEQIWSGQYDRELKDVFEVMSEISQKVASEVKAAITPEVKERIEVIPTENMLAYENFLRGREYHQKYSNDIFRRPNSEKQDLNNAIYFYKKSIELDPKFGLAYAWLGLALGDPEEWYYERILNTKYDTVKLLVSKALEIDSNIVEAYWIKAWYILIEVGDFDECIRLYKKALNKNPNYGDAMWFLGWMYSVKGDHVNGLIYFKKAWDLKFGSENFDRYVSTLGLRYLDICDFTNAEIVYRELRDYNPSESNILILFLKVMNGEKDIGDVLPDISELSCKGDSSESCFKILSELYLEQNMYKKAHAFRKKFRQRQSSRGVRGVDNHIDGLIYWNLGNKKVAMDCFQQEIDYCSYNIKKNNLYAVCKGKFDLAAIYAFLGDEDASMSILREVEKDGFIRCGQLNSLQSGPFFQNLRNNEEFWQIINRQEKILADTRAKIDRLAKQGML